MRRFNAGLTRRLTGVAACIGMLVLAGGCANNAQLASLSGDYVTPVKPPPGFIFADVKAPLTYELNGNPTGANATKANSKEVQYIQFLWWRSLSAAWDDIDIASVASEGNISEVSYADYEYFNVLTVYRRLRVNVYGN